MKKVLLVCLLLAVSVFSFGCAGSGSGSDRAIWSSNFDPMAANVQDAE